MEFSESWNISSQGKGNIDYTNYLYKDSDIKLDTYLKTVSKKVSWSVSGTIHKEMLPTDVCLLHCTYLTWSTQIKEGALTQQNTQVLHTSPFSLSLGAWRFQSCKHAMPTKTYFLFWSKRHRQWKSHILSITERYPPPKDQNPQSATFFLAKLFRV